MQVILLEKLANLGNLGDVVRVRNGYARNYLIPQKKARRASEQALQEFAARRAELEKAQADRLAVAQALANRLEGHLLTLVEKAGVDGRLFGSVSNADIALALRNAGFDSVEKAQIRLPDGPFKMTGEFDVALSLHTDVQANIKVQIAGEVA